MPLRVIPVLDLKSGRAVHAVAGDRDHYRPIRSVVHPDSDPIGLARAYRDVLGLRDLYLADLDAIAGAPPSGSLYRSLASLGLVLWVDAGIRDAKSLGPWLETGVDTLVVGLETVRGPRALADVLYAVGPSRVTFSLDLREGLPLIARDADWDGDDLDSIVRTAVSLGVRRFLVLDLARVGTGRGPGTFPLIRELSVRYPETEWAVGGGVSGLADLTTLRRYGIGTALIASALHDGRIDADDLASLREGPPDTPAPDFSPTPQ